MRVLLFLAVNFAILMLASFTLRLLGVGHYVNQHGLDLNALLIWCAMFGFGGAFISLALSKWMAKRAMRAQVIAEPRGEQQRWLVDTVSQLAGEAGIGMPEVAIFPSAAPNAFATGASRNKALVAVSSGMLDAFPRDEVRAVMAHEIGHVANGDMVTLTLIQGVVNTFVMFFARIIAYAVDRLVFRNTQGVGIGFYLTTIVIEIVLAVFASMIVMWFSRRREFRADQWGARLGGRTAMIGALERLRGDTKQEQMPGELVAFGIKHTSRGGIARLLASHPPLEDRIAALRREA